MKKFISRVLICAMLISVLPKTNFADEEKVKSEAVNKEEPAKNEKTEKNAEKKETKVENKKEAKAEEKIEKKEAKPEEKVEKKEEVKETIKTEKPVPVKVRKSENIKPLVTDDYKVEYIFESGTEGKELPAEVLALKPVNQPAVTNGSEISLPDFTEVKVEGGTWKFEKWYVDLQGNYTAVNGNKVKVESADLRLVGVWKFTPNNPEPEKYDVTFSFESETPGKELPDEIKAKIPADQLGVPDGTLIHLPKYDSVKVEGGKWEFVHWRIEVEGKDDDFSLGIDKFVNGADMKMVGIWKFEEDPKPEKYNIEFQFYSVTKGKELPDEIKAKLPANKTDVLNGTEIPLPNYEDVKVKGGTWKFLGWYSIKGAEHNKVENKVVVDNDNLYLLGQWKFEADKKPQPKPQKPKVQKGRILPKTNVESAFTYVVLALAGIGGAYIAKKKDNE